MPARAARERERARRRGGTPVCTARAVAQLLVAGLAIFACAAAVLHLAGRARRRRGVTKAAAIGSLSTQVNAGGAVSNRAPGLTGYGAKKTPLAPPSRGDKGAAATTTAAVDDTSARTQGSADSLALDSSSARPRGRMPPPPPPPPLAPPQASAEREPPRTARKPGVSSLNADLAGSGGLDGRGTVPSKGGVAVAAVTGEPTTGAVKSSAAVAAYWASVDAKTGPRVIDTFIFNKEFEMLELRFRELDPVVDAFVIVESNYTHFGKPKPLHYRANKLGLRLSPFAHKVVYVPMGMARELLTKSGCEIGWIHNINMVKEIGRGLKGLPFTPRDDDIVVVGDADEIPSRHAVQQLKSSWGSGCDVYRLKMRWSFYGFFWHNRGRHSQTSTARRFGQDQRRRASNGHLAEKACDMPQGGWHCSWCFHDSDYRTKLTAALCGDGVRFGDFHWPDRTIKILRSRGIWFGADSIPPYTPAKINDGDAPLWALENPERFRYLLQPPADPEHRSARPVMPYCPCDAPVRNLPGGGRMECDPAMDSIVGRYNSADRSYLQRLRSVWCH